MQITIKGQLTLAQLRQAIYEKLLELEDDFALRHSLGATLYVNPTNKLGEPVELRRQDGSRLQKMVSDGPYKSAADEFKI
jgi:hypothetical protein